MRRVLVIASHPDDEILGAGGTVARMVKEGAEVATLLIGMGRPTCEFENYKKSQNANKIMGSYVISQPISIFPDNEFDSVPLLRIVEFIEKNINRFKPDIIFTHYANDLNIDHRITYQAVITATRPMPGETVKEIYSFEIPSSTEWAFPTTFSPDYFVDIESTFQQKIEALKCYESEMREFPHPRSETGIINLAMQRGMQVGLKCAEAFKTVRVIR